MNITVTSFYLPPIDLIGAGVQMHMLANAYVRLGHSVTLVSPNQESPSDSLYRFVSHPISGVNRVLRWPIALRKTKYDPGLVHFAGDNHLVQKRNQIIRLRTFHGSCFAEAKSSKKIRDRVRMSYLGITELLGQRMCDVGTVVSADTNRFFPRPNVVIPNGVDLSKFTPSVKSKSKNPSILFVGMLDSRKRGRQLLEVFAKEIRVKIPNAEFWIVRDSTPVEIPGVKVFGHVSQETLISLYQSAWCFCLPSIYEGFGIPYIEAMACGTPVVASPNPGALEVTKDGTYGVVADLDDLGEELINLLCDDRRLRSFSESGLEYVQRFDIDKVAQRYLDIAVGT